MSLQNDFMHFWQFEIWRRCCLMRLADKTVKTISTISKQILAFKGLLYFFASKCWLHVSLFNVFCCLFSHKMLPFLKNEMKLSKVCLEIKPLEVVLSVNIHSKNSLFKSDNIKTAVRSAQRNVQVKILVPDFSFYFISVISIYVIPQLSSSCV